MFEDVRTRYSRLDYNYGIKCIHVRFGDSSSFFSSFFGSRVFLFNLVFEMHPNLHYGVFDIFTHKCNS